MDISNLVGPKEWLLVIFGALKEWILVVLRALKEWLLSNIEAPQGMASSP